MTLNTFHALVQSQKEWGKRSGRGRPQSVYANSIADNLFGDAVSPRTDHDFDKGSGGEFRAKEGELPKGLVLHSSSVLVRNVFDYWRGKALAPLTNTLKPPRSFIDFRFEGKYGTGVRGGPCNLDLAFRCDDDWVVGVESKFTEPFAAKRELPFVQPAYIKIGRPSSWQAIGLDGCHELAMEYFCTDEKRMASHIDVRFHHLDVPQLLKHVLGLHRASQGKYRLLYIWFDSVSRESKKHRDEIEDFHQASQLGSRFGSLTYQEFIPRLGEYCSPDDTTYLKYLTDRYGLGVV